jgi:ABC-type branched-subunit amino acid transport system substrate-binding protein
MSIAPRCLLASLLLVPPGGVAAEHPVTLGLVAPPSEADATSLLRGAQLAVAETNEGGQARVVLEVRSENGQWGSVGNEAVTLVCNRHVDALITPSDGPASHLILQVASRTRVPVATVCADSSVTDAGVPWTVRVVPRTDQAAKALFAATRQPNDLPLHWWAVVPAGRVGRAVRRDLETAARATATPVDRIMEGDEPEADLASLVHTIVAAAPGGMLLWLPPSQAGTLVAALRAAGYGGRLAGPSTLASPAFFAAAGSGATGVLATRFQADADLRARADSFESRYRLRFGAKPDFSAAAAYDAAHVLIEILRRAGDGAGYRQFPLAVSIAGVTGVLHFDHCGNRTDALQVLTCQQGRFLPMAPTETSL